MTQNEKLVRERAQELSQAAGSPPGQDDYFLRQAAFLLQVEAEEAAQAAGAGEESGAEQVAAQAAEQERSDKRVGATAAAG